MKYFIKVFSILICVLGLVGCRPDGTTDTPELEEITRFTQEQLNERLVGLPQEEIHDSWGNPDGHLSGFLGEIWTLDNEDNIQIIIYYDNDGLVEHIKINKLKE